jgi:C-terminal processing protease CtpA/Prc
MAGLFLEQNMDGSFMVRDVIKNSPGFRQGIQRDDRIVAINGKEINKYRYVEVFDMFRQEGKKIRVTIRRESGRFDFTLTLKRLI